MLSTSYWQPRTPADRPGIMLFSPVMGKKCNKNVHGVCLEGDEQTSTGLRQKTRNWFCEKPSIFSRVLSSSGSCWRWQQQQRRVRQPQACRTASSRGLHFHHPSAVHAGGFSVCPRNKRWFGSLLVLCRAPWPVCWSHHPLLSYPWGRRAGGAVGWQRLCTGDLSWQNRFFPCVFLYIFLSSNCTGKTCSKGSFLRSLHQP